MLGSYLTNLGHNFDISNFKILDKKGNLEMLEINNKNSLKETIKEYVTHQFL